VIYREAPTLLEELADATLAGTRKGYIAELATVPLLIVDDLCMRKLAHTAAEDRGNAARQLYLRRDHYEGRAGGRRFTEVHAQASAI
jgi:hypothetical protein